MFARRPRSLELCPLDSTSTPEILLFLFLQLTCPSRRHPKKFVQFLIESVPLASRPLSFSAWYVGSPPKEVNQFPLPLFYLTTLFGRTFRPRVSLRDQLLPSAFLALLFRPKPASNSAGCGGVRSIVCSLHSFVFGKEPPVEKGPLKIATPL